MSLPSLHQSRIAVTGSDGFVGRWLIESLQSLKIPVVQVQGDVRDPNTWDVKFDLLYHLAARMPRDFIETPEEALSVNFNGVLQALEACRHNQAHIVFTSTCGLYKPGQRQPVLEDDPLEPPTAYTQSKFMGEMLCRCYAQHYGVKATVLRLFNVYGLSQNKDYIIPYLIKCGINGHKAEIKHPDSSRDFISIKDVVDVLLRAASPKESFNVYNVGTGTSHTLIQVIELIEAASAKKIDYTRIKSAPDPQPMISADTGRITRDLGWSAKVSLKDGIFEMIHHYNQLVKNSGV